MMWGCGVEGGSVGGKVRYLKVRRDDVRVLVERWTCERGWDGMYCISV